MPPKSRLVVKSNVALIVGINYFGTSSELGGCVKDALNAKTFFEKIGYNIIFMTDAPGTRADMRPTFDNIMRQLSRILARADVEEFALYYAGHGTRVSDVSGDENDGMDEALYTVDEKTIIDDELLRMCKNALNISAIRLFFDCCHSGTIADLESKFEDSPVCSTKQLPVIMSFSACRDHQTAGDTNVGGVMTTKLLPKLREGPICAKKLQEHMLDIPAQQRFTMSTSVPLHSNIPIFNTKSLIAIVPENSNQRSISEVERKPNYTVQW